MVYVNWYKFKKDGMKEHQKSVPEDAIVWQDLITETIFYLEKKDWEKITNAGIEYLKEIKGQLDEVHDYLTETIHNVKEDYLLFPQLPYKFNNSAEKAHRVSDHLILRTGILYAVNRGKMTKEEIRTYGLFFGLEKFGGNVFLQNLDLDTANLLNEIDNILLGKATSLSDLKVDIVKGGVVKVKQYFLETNNIKNIRGASIILDSINTDIVPNYIANKFIPESLIYAGGGNVLVIVPHEQGGLLAKEIEKIYEQRTVTAQNVAISKTIILKDLAEYKKTFRKIEEELEERQLFKLDWRDNPNIGDLNYPYIEGDKGYIKNNAVEEIAVKVRNTNQDRCQQCNIRFSSYNYNGENLCRSCLHKTAVGQEGRKGFRDKCLEYVNNYINNWGPKGINASSVEDLKDNNNSIAVIYGDGNNMGKIVQNIESITQMRYFSDIVEKTIFYAVYKSIYECFSDLKFEIVAIGGDDILMIVPGDKGIELSKKICEKFDNSFENLSKEKGLGNVTLSLGVVISHYTRPIQYLFDIAQQLLKNAKKKARNTLEGTIDILAIVNDNLVGVSLAKERKEEREGGLHLTLRPFTRTELNNIQMVISKLKEKGLWNRSFKFREAQNSLTIEEANLFYLYNLNKEKKEENREVINRALMDLAKNFDAQVQVMNLVKGGKKYTPWFDIVELWDYI